MGHEEIDGAIKQVAPMRFHSTICSWNLGLRVVQGVKETQRRSVPPLCMLSFLHTVLRSFVPIVARQTAQERVADHR